MTSAFDTLLDGRLRCEYDQAKRIKGKWYMRGQTCYDAFYEEYREEILVRLDKEREALRQMRKLRSKPPKPEAEPPKPKEAAFAMGSTIADHWAYMREMVAHYSARVISFVSWT